MWERKRRGIAKIAVNIAIIECRDPFIAWKNIKRKRNKKQKKQELI